MALFSIWEPKKLAPRFCFEEQPTVTVVVQFMRGQSRRRFAWVVEETTTVHDLQRAIAIRLDERDSDIILFNRDFPFLPQSKTMCDLANSKHAEIVINMEILHQD